MKRLKLHLLTTLSMLFCFCSAHAAGVVDITSGNIVNPSFENDDITKLTPKTESADGLRGYIQTQPVGWTYSGSSLDKQLIVTAACYTDNNFGKVTTLADGSQAYYLRMGWSNGSSTLTQNVKLPKGKYRFAADIRSAYANSASSSIKVVAAGSSSSMPFSQGSASCFTSMVWNTGEAEFTLTEETTVSLGFSITWVSGGSCVMIDNVRLYDITNETVDPDPTEKDVPSPTEGVIDNTFVPESEMMNDLLKMLARFTPYMKSYWFQCASPNSINESCGFFYNTENGTSPSCPNGEKGVRPNADLSMIAAFLVKYAKPAGIALPDGITYDLLEEYAMKSLIYAYSTHKANKLKVCSGNNYWGSVSTSDNVWESSLWAMSVAYSAYFQWEKLSDAQKGYIYALLKAECNYELGRSVPTGYAGDTKAEENGWEADVLAATLGLFPDDDLADKWYERMRLFAVNSYSHSSDAMNANAIDPDHNSTTVADLYKGNNLYADYTLQNHNLFHTSYQNVVMQELGEAALALQLFQSSRNADEQKVWGSNALQHNNQEVMDNVLNWLALADGELAMPNGNDWSLFLYDQITSYSTQACFQRDPNALLLENLAYKQIKARQTTTADGSWLLRPDVAARRMGVEAHRVMMTYLMHLTNSTANLTPTSWDDFRNAHSTAKLLECQNVVRAYTPERFSCFSWSSGLQSYTGYFTADKADKNKIIVPYRANNSGNITGWYEVSGKGTNATPVINGIYQFDGNAWVMNGELAVNDKALDNRFAIYSTPGNAIMYLDCVKANSACTITGEKGGLLAISTDELTKLKRTLYYDGGEGSITWKQTDGTTRATFASDWVNIDNEIGVVGHNGKKIAFGDRGANNSIYTSKLYPMFCDDSRSVKANDIVDTRHLVYYSNVTAETTKAMADAIVKLSFTNDNGWNGIIARDPSGTYYVMVANFFGNIVNSTSAVDNIAGLGAPIYAPEVVVENNKSTMAAYVLSQNNSYAKPINFFINSEAKMVVQHPSDNVLCIIPDADALITIRGINSNGTFSKNVQVTKENAIKVTLTPNGLEIENTEVPIPYNPQSGDDMTGYIKNPRFAGNSTDGWEITCTTGSGTKTTNYNSQEFWQCTSFNIQQVVKGLPEGRYRLSCQGFYRDGSYTQAATAYAAGTFTANAQLYANNAQTGLPSICSEAGTMGSLGVSTSVGYIPNNMEQTQQYFYNGGYNTELDVEVGDSGTMTIGIKKDNLISNDWTIFTNFRLTYFGNTTGAGGVQEFKGARLTGDSWYDLQGRRVSGQLKPGIYVSNGKKIAK